MKQGVLVSPLQHADETGVHLGGKLHWIHVNSTRFLTHLAWHQKRGRETLEAIGIWPHYQGRSMRDRWASYDRYRGLHSMRGAHVVRDLTYEYEHQGQVWAGEMKEVLLGMYTAACEWRERGATRLPTLERDDWVIQYFDVLARGFAAQPPPAQDEAPKRRGRQKQTSSKPGGVSKPSETTLSVLEQIMPREHIRLVHTGGPGERLLALLRGEIEAATLLDPEIPIAETKGLRNLARGEFMITFWVSRTISRSVLQAYFRALKRADESLAEHPEQYLHLWERNVPPGLKGEYDYSTFGLGEKFVFEPYTEEMFQRALQFAERWNLHTHIQDNQYSHLIIPASI